MSPFSLVLAPTPPIYPPWWYCYLCEGCCYCC